MACYAHAAIALAMGLTFATHSVEGALIGYWNLDSIGVEQSGPTDIAEPGAPSYTPDSGGFIEDSVAGALSGPAATLTLTESSTGASGRGRSRNSLSGTTENLFGLESIPNSAWGLASRNGGTVMFITIAWDGQNENQYDLSFALDQRGGTGTGAITVEYQNDGGGWTTVGSPISTTNNNTTAVGDWEVVSVDFGAAFDVGTSHEIRLTFPIGPGSEFVTPTSGTFLDNFQLNAIPEPATLALLSVAAPIVLRRRMRS